jgi:hypothetical protein
MLPFRHLLVTHMLRLAYLSMYDVVQHVCEQLECRAQPVQVDMEPGEDDSDGSDDWDGPDLVDADSDE